MINAVYVMPHPPIIVPGIGDAASVTDTIKAARKAADKISKLKPETIIVISPHATVFKDFIHISKKEVLSGSFSAFGRSDINYEFKNNTKLAEIIIKKARQIGLPIGTLDKKSVGSLGIDSSLDHGCLVPLHFIKEKFDNFNIVEVPIAGFSYKDLYKTGKCIQEAVNEAEIKAVVISSADLSHKLTSDGPYGYAKEGSIFDDKVNSFIKNNDFEGLMTIDEKLIKASAQCGLPSIVIGYGCIDGYALKSEVLSYQGPLGVGYLVAEIIPDEKSQTSDDTESKKEDMYIKLAKTTLEKYVKDNKVIKPGDYNLPEEMLNEKAGVFVSIKTSNGDLRGCIGTIKPYRDNIANEVISNAVSAGTKDPRFMPVTEKELESLVYSVDILKAPEKINSIDELDVKKYGVIVKKGSRSGLLLPNLDGIDKPEEQVNIALRKAGISQDEDYNMERFEVIRHE